MKSKIIVSLALLLASLILSQAQSTIVGWTFENITAPTTYVPNPAPSTFNGVGTESASAIGMVGTPAAAAGTNDPDVLAGKNSDTGANAIGDTTHEWRVRAQNAAGTANGWYSGSAIGTQGAVFAVDTTGYNTINVRFDWYATTQGEANMQVQYTDDGSTWINVPINVPAAESELASNYNNGSDPNTVTGYYVANNIMTNMLDGQDWFTNLSVSINDPNAANNPHFAVEIVNASTGASCVSTAGTALNNNSGNWRFDNVVISGTPGAGGLASPPTLTPAAGIATTNTTFSIAIPAGNAAWQRAITNITFNGVALVTPTSTNGVNISSSSITVSNSSAAVFQTSGAFNLLIGASGYIGASIVQPIAPGPATQMILTTQPTAPTGNGGTLVLQPVVEFFDVYSNMATNVSPTFAATPSAGWGFGLGSGSNGIVTVGGIATFTNLSAVSSAAVSGATITLTATGSGLTPDFLTSSNFNIPAPVSTGFTPGYLVVEQLDDNSKNSTFSMIELNPSATNSAPVLTLPVPATGTNGLRQSSAGSTGLLSDSQDGTLVCFSAGQWSDASLSDVTTVTNRGCGTFDATGNYVLQTTYQGFGGATADQARSATTVDDTNFYMGDKGGVYTNNDDDGNAYIIYITGGFGANVRGLKTFGGTVYAMQQEGGSDTNATVMTIVPPPSSEEQALAPLEGFPKDGNVLDFYMVQSDQNGSDYDTVYYIDETNVNSGEIFKYFNTYQVDGNTGLQVWQLAGSWATTNGGDGLCAQTNANGGVDLYYTTDDGGTTKNSVIHMYDNSAYNAPMNVVATNTLYTAPAKVILKGIAFAPLPAPGVVPVYAAGNITNLVYTASGVSAGATLTFGSAASASNSFAVWSTTNLSTPFAYWNYLGHPTEGPSGTYSLTDSSATNNPATFYRVTSP